MGINYKEYDAIIETCKEISKSKSNDYGTTPLTKFGDKGVLVRMTDKIERLINMCWYNRDSMVADEKIEDTALDLINYAIYFILLRKNTFEDDV